MPDDGAGACRGRVRQEQEGEHGLGTVVACEGTRRRHGITPLEPGRSERSVRLAIGGQDPDSVGAEPRHVHRGGTAIGVIEDIALVFLDHAPHPEHPARQQPLSPGDPPEHERGEHGERADAREDQPGRRTAGAGQRPEGQQAQQHIERAAGQERAAQAQQRQQQQARGGGAHDRAERIGCVDRADGPLAAASQQHPRHQRQRHAGAERGGQHDRQADQVTRHREQDVAGIASRRGLDQRRGPAERLQVERKAEQRERPHHQLHDRQGSQRIDEAIGPPPHPPGPERETEDESGEHQLEGMGGAAQNQREHAEPADLVDKGGDRGAESEGEEKAGPVARSGRRGVSRPPDLPTSRRIDPPPARHRQRTERNKEIEHGGRRQRAGQSRHRVKHESRDQYPCRSAQAVTEVEDRQRATRLVRQPPQHAGAHQREGGAEQDGLRQDEQRGQHPLAEHDRGAPAESGEQVRVGPAGNRKVDHVVEGEPEDADDRFHHGVHKKRVANPCRATAHQQRAQTHPAQEDHQGEHLGVRIVADEQTEVAAPDRLVEEAGRAGQQEQQREDRAHPAAGCSSYRLSLR